jgi:hypothetical protein
MNEEPLTAFWIVPPGRRAPLGFGVTAYDLDDALAILRTSGYGDFLSPDRGALKITQGVRYADLEEHNVRKHMGPIVVRGLWYPFFRLGIDDDA